ncbi:MAG: GFA family protein [Pseudomonadota bacterium]
MPVPFEGGCVCGALRYSCSAEPIVAGHCQCNACRRSSGTGHSSTMMVPKDAVTIAGEVKLYESTADSGNAITRAFCPTCGASVYLTNSGAPKGLFLRASSLDDPEIFQPQMVVNSARGASWDKLDPTLPSFEAMPPNVGEIMSGGS